MSGGAGQRRPRRDPAPIHAQQKPTLVLARPDRIPRFGRRKETPEGFRVFGYLQDGQGADYI